MKVGDEVVITGEDGYIGQIGILQDIVLHQKGFTDVVWNVLINGDLTWIYQKDLRKLTPLDKLI